MHKDHSAEAAMASMNASLMVSTKQSNRDVNDLLSFLPFRKISFANTRSDRGQYPTYAADVIGGLQFLMLQDASFNARSRQRPGRSTLSD
ncbi:hypothetical protein [Mesorhizobium sp. M0910]|uniref:hypothetical protein n=1 Tax=Mesorhizobium sp. M0910 TaxID=2957025 RepID=UPI00333CF524